MPFPIASVAFHLPPTRASRVSESRGMSTWFPPHHVARDSGVTQASKTASGGAAIVRVIVKPGESVIGRALRFVGEVLFQRVKALVPERAIVIDPLSCRCECDRVQAR